MKRSQKRGAKRKSRVNKIYKSPNSTVFNVNCECLMTLRGANASSAVQCFESGLAYINISNLLTTATTFTENTTRFAMYRINGVKIEARPIFEPSSTTVNEHIVFGLGFYPSQTAAYIGSNQVMNYDKSLVCSTNQPIMSRKQTFYNNYYEGTGSGGYGTWNASSSASGITGSIQIGNYPAMTAFASAASIAIVRVIFNVTFKEKQLTA
jgi:predicted secreted protein